MLFHLATVVVQAGALMLIVGALHSLRSWRRLLASLLAHRLLPYRVARPLARFGPLLQVCIGVGVVVAVCASSGPRWFALWAVLAYVAAYGAMCAYLVTLLAVRGRSHCNCFGTAQPVNTFSVLRTGLPAVAGVALAIDLSRLADRPSLPGLLAAVLLAATLMWAPSISRTGASTRPSATGPARVNRPSAES